MKTNIKRLLRENLANHIKLNQYYEWLSEAKIPVEIQRLKNVIPQEDISNPKLYEFKKNQFMKIMHEQIKPNECFNNAHNAFFILNKLGFDVKFVLGIMVENGREFGHAWNEINGEQYDLSAEKTKTFGNQYFEVYIYDNLNEIRQLTVFDPNAECPNAMTVNNQNYDVNGLCSIYPEYLKESELEL